MPHLLIHAILFAGLVVTWDIYLYLHLSSEFCRHTAFTTAKLYIGFPHNRTLFIFVWPYTYTSRANISYLIVSRSVTWSAWYMALTVGHNSLDPVVVSAVLARCPEGVQRSLEYPMYQTVERCKPSTNCMSLLTKNQYDQLLPQFSSTYLSNLWRYYNLWKGHFLTSASALWISLVTLTFHL